jgi:MFS family permease
MPPPIGAWLCDRLCFQADTGKERLLPAPPRAVRLLATATKEKKEKGSLTLWFAAFVGCLSAGMGGYVFSYTSPTLTNDCSVGGCPHCLNCELNLDEAIKSSTASIAMFGGLVGSMLGGRFADQSGRRAGMVAGMTTATVGWLSIALCASVGGHPPTAGGPTPMLTVLLLLGGRGLTGVAMGLCNIAYPLYIAEASPPHLRGLLTAGFQFGTNFSCLAAYAAGLVVGWQPMAFLPAVITGGCLLGLLLAVPESPRWLLARGQRARAEAALASLRASGSDVNATLDQIEADLRPQAGTTTATVSVDQSTSLLSQLCVRPIAIAAAVMAGQNLTGIGVVTAYFGEIMAGLFGDKANYYVTGVSAICFLVTPLPMWLVDRYGRRPCLLFSAMMMGSMATLEGFCFYLRSCGVSSPALNVVSFLASLFYGMGFSFGAGPVPFMVLSELAPPGVRGVASSVVQGLNWLIIAGLAQIGDVLQHKLGDDGLYWLFGALCFAWSALVWAIMPETKGLRLEAIQKEW